MSVFDRIFKKPVDYVEGRVGEVREQLRTDASDILASLSILLIVALFAGVSLLLISLAFALVIAIWLGLTLGYVIISCMYAVVAYLTWRYYQNTENRQRLKSRIHKAISPGEPEKGFYEPETTDAEDIYG